MPYSRMVEIGRVAYISSGPEEGKLCVVVEVIDGNRALVDGPCSGVRRQAMNFKNIQLTKFVVSIRHGARTRNVKLAWEKAEMDKNWEETQWAKKLHKRQLRAQMSDFDRFKLMKAKQARNRIIRAEMNKLKKAKQ